MEKTFSPSQDIDVGNYLNGGKSLREQDSLVTIWTVIGESWFVQLLRNAYKRESKHQKMIINQESKPSKRISVFLQVHKSPFPDS